MASEQNGGSDGESTANVFARESTGLVREVSALDASLIGASNGPLGQYVLFSLPFGAGLLAAASTSSFYWAALIAALFSIPVLLNYSALTAAMPRSGGDYVFNSRLIHPALGFSANFSLAFWQVIGAGAWAVLTVKTVISPALTILGSILESNTLTRWGEDVTQSGWVTTIAIALILAITLLLISGTKRALRVNSILWFVGMLSMTLMIGILLFTSHDGFVQNYDEFAGHAGAYNQVIKDAADAGFTTHNSFEMLWPLVALAMGVFGWYFWMTFFGGEIKQAKSFGRVTKMMCAPLIINLVYVLVLTALIFNVVGYEFFCSAAYLAFVDPSKLVAAAASGPPVFFTAISAGSNFLAALFVITFLAWGWVLLTCLLVMPVRCGLAWSLDQVFPNKLMEVSQRFNTPLYMTGLVAALAIVVAIIATSTEQVLQIFAVTVMATGLFSQGVTGLGAMLFPSRLPDLYRQQTISRYRVFGIPLIRITGLIAFVWTIFWASAYVKYSSEFGLEGWIAAVFAGIFLFGLALFYFMRWYKERRGIPVRLVFSQIPPE